MKEDSVQDNKLNLLGKLSAGLFHELRNPLSVIKLNLDLITHHYKSNLDPDVLESINDCKIAVSRIEDMTDNILNVARKANNVNENIQLPELIKSALNVVTVNSSKKNINLVTKINSPTEQVYGNKNKLLQILLNIINNAIDACKINGRVIISLDKNINGEQILQIEDNGCGISEEDQKNIFDDFFTNKKEGTGLGLSVCKMLLDEIDSKLTFKSEINKGTIFTITFPKTESE